MESTSRHFEGTAAPVTPSQSQSDSAVPTCTGALIINADDWGRDCETTDRTQDCMRAGSVSAVSAMVFMADSERAAALARESDVDAGLHLNFTTSFSGGNVGARLPEHQERAARHLSKHAFARAIYNPALANSFEYVVAAQIEEFRKLYGREPGRFDGHHHMHLSANVLFSGLLPRGAIVRRHFSFEDGEKFRNRLFRMATGAVLKSRYRVVDYLFSLPPMKPQSRLERIFSQAQHSIVELETHSIHPEEYAFLTSGGISRLTDMLGTQVRATRFVDIGQCFALRSSSLSS